MRICVNPEILWEADLAARFRKICQDTLGRDCICEDGKPCPLDQITGRASYLPATAS
jgi:hypothetical protein